MRPWILIIESCISKFLYVMIIENPFVILNCFIWFLWLLWRLWWFWWLNLTRRRAIVFIVFVMEFVFPSYYKVWSVFIFLKPMCFMCIRNLIVVLGTQFISQMASLFILRLTNFISFISIIVLILNVCIIFSE